MPAGHLASQPAADDAAADDAGRMLVTPSGPMMQPQMMQPQMHQVMQAPPPQVIVNQGSGPQYIAEVYVGPVTIAIFVILLIVFWPACFAPFCCPCDTRKRPLSLVPSDCQRHHWHIIM